MIIYISLGFFGILVILLASGCSIYYPTSYRAFIPKQWDSEYKEYERLCKENIGKVVYARPITQEEFEKMDALLHKPAHHFFSYRYTPVSKSIYELRISLHNDLQESPDLVVDNIIYQIIGSYAYDRYWTELIFFTKGSPTSEKFLKCQVSVSERNLLAMAFEKQQNIGTKDDIISIKYGNLRTIKKDINNAK
ncbi:hypothetical protein [Helicobacter didelphidarum]|uniref:hypothetical protein n=1 Tax=Helicobacter didelphidarum TaxID=2040648 RepID=UPI001FE8D784|nr:hypothetical protein [Helicobacter didelphidarum]